MGKNFTRMCYGERFPLYVKDAKPKPQAKRIISDDTNKKLEHVLLLLTKLLEGEQKAYDKAKQQRFQKMCAEAEQGYGNRNPHNRRNKNRLSIPVESFDQKPLSVRDTSSYDLVCMEAAMAYASRNPHLKGGKKHDGSRHYD